MIIDHDSEDYGGYDNNKKYLVASPCKKTVENIHRVVARPLQHKPDHNDCEDVADCPAMSLVLVC